MESQKFAEAYPYDLWPSEIRNGKHSRYTYEAQDYSYKWGRVLHAALGNAALDTFVDVKDELGYYDWIQNGLESVQHKVMEAPIDVARGGLNQLNFHLLNDRMRWQWKPLRAKSWDSDAQRSQEISKAQHFLALDGLQTYIDRERFIQQHGGEHALFTPEYGELHEGYTGMIQEYDAAIILLDVVRKHRELCVVPAPAQFEHSSDRQRNVDFVVVDFVNERAVGIQVKSLVQKADVEQADAERVIFLDGNIDLNNIKVVKPLKNKKTEITTPWPGIIAAKRVDAIKSYGRQALYFPQTHFLTHNKSPSLVQMKLAARKLVGNLKVDHQELATRIESRILHKL